MTERTPSDEARTRLPILTIETLGERVEQLRRGVEFTAECRRNAGAEGGEGWKAKADHFGLLEQHQETQLALARIGLALLIAIDDLDDGTIKNPLGGPT